MKTTNSKQLKLAAYNGAVKAAYHAILKIAKQLLSTVAHEELRYSLTREDKSANEAGSIIHEFLTPMLYIRLDCGFDNVYSIHFGVETFDKPNEFTTLTAKFIRTIYRLTSKELTHTNIEHSVQVDWVIINCSEMYQHIEERNRHHTFKLITHKVTAKQRKQLLSVA
ncbi:hypothetical protein ABIB62_003008 [Mucilaginibacter sp. UYP25]|uniref:hypothetical protein n=1 Tax=unclassified Mucilaginibacter TaxID=2617802 RepID=UPI003399086D